MISLQWFLMICVIVTMFADEVMSFIAKWRKRDSSIGKHLDRVVYLYVAFALAAVCFDEYSPWRIVALATSISGFLSNIVQRVSLIRVKQEFQ